MATRTPGNAARKTSPGPSKKAAAKTPGKPPAKKAAARKAPAKKAAARSAPPPPPPNRSILLRALNGLASPIAAIFRGVGDGAKNLHPAHRKDGLGLVLFALGLVTAAGTWFSEEGWLNDAATAVVSGLFGRLDVLVPFLLAGIAIRLWRHPELPEANGRIVIGLSALVVGVLGLVHIGCGAPTMGSGASRIRA
ncbi:cell division protein FtsK, partial [Kitasatospora sp. NPDC093558]